MHPSHILPIVGSRNPQRIRHAVDALNIDIGLENWFRIYNASTGKSLP